MFFEKENDEAQTCEENCISESIFGNEELDSTKECTMPHHH